MRKLLFALWGLVFCSVLSAQEVRKNYFFAGPTMSHYTSETISVEKVSSFVTFIGNGKGVRETRLGRYDITSDVEPKGLGMQVGLMHRAFTKNGFSLEIGAMVDFFRFEMRILGTDFEFDLIRRDTIDYEPPTIFSPSFSTCDSVVVLSENDVLSPPQYSVVHLVLPIRASFDFEKIPLQIGLAATFSTPLRTRISQRSFSQREELESGLVVCYQEYFNTKEQANGSFNNFVVGIENSYRYRLSERIFAELSGRISLNSITEKAAAAAFSLGRPDIQHLQGALRFGYIF